jgi:HEAT repeat protein
MYTKSTPDGAAYPPPLDRLLLLGDTGLYQRDWHDYAEMGIAAKHVPELLRMAADPELNTAPSNEPRVYAPLHAWRALGLLRAPQAAAPLVELLVRYEDDSAREDLPRVLGMIGEAAVEPVTAVLDDPSAALFTRVAAAHALEQIGQRHSALRDRVVGLLIDHLIDWPEQDETLNAFLIDYLVELGASEAAPLMEAAFAAHAVDESVRGDWEDVMVDLSLMPERLTPLPPPPWIGRMSVRALPPPAPSRCSGKAAAKAKNRRKAEKQARKRNRK